MASLENPLSIFDRKTVLITGGTGSFGSAFTERVLRRGKPRAIRIYSRDELKQYEMRRALKDDSRLRFFIGDVRDGVRLKRACEGVDFIVHAAAMKQIPACEYNPIEAIRTNVDGSINLIEAALETNTARVIALSSDKAVYPVNLYGATKLCAEKLFVQANSYSGPKRKTCFSVVRYGNVFASRGSVVPLFKDQISRGQPITITDKRMTRFWITLDQAVKFVATSFAIMRGGEVFVPKIPSMKIVDLAKALGHEGRWEIIGMRPGEKIHECLITQDEGPRTYALRDRYTIEPDFKWWQPKIAKSMPRGVPEGFYYTSKNNTEWLKVSDMKKIIREA